MFSNIGSGAIKKGLQNIELLCTFLNHPEQKFKSIHIAGTNGKGSVAHLLTAILMESGLKVGLYTSPHLTDFRERIKINGKMIPKKTVNHFVEIIKPQIDTLQPSFFEITVAMAFDYFANQKVDIAVIETGLGGRLDSTNIIEPILSVITNISFDHKAILGNTLQAIASEKAGIIKPKIPVVIGRKNMETDNVFIKKAKTSGSKIYFAEDAFPNATSVLSGNRLIIDCPEIPITIKSPLTAHYQLENIKTTLCAIKYLPFFEISKSQIRNGIKNTLKHTHFKGRWQTISKNPKIIIDVGHNEDAIKLVMKNLEFEKFERLHIIFGAVKDKDVDAIFTLLPKFALYYFTQPNNERKLSINDLEILGKLHQLHFQLFEDPKLALKTAKKEANKNDLILIIGSFFIVNSFL